ncbi:hypothetical protein P171DRAFT_205163 [Karstenula rhodostoma CBS 690.94]|uniref:Uncharacterized protein n=1 Tax=Karstenula rhodostoma CBS 690.94 TaxID=1392251 RepID=A0A9P4UFK5_9PLEO|nr:hypothetical protein P171DRAFT_205163 [Karstenula rhodostoma CBS 690.94]
MHIHLRPLTILTPCYPPVSRRITSIAISPDYGAGLTPKIKSVFNPWSEAPPRHPRHRLRNHSASNHSASRTLHLLRPHGDMLDANGLRGRKYVVGAEFVLGRYVHPIPSHPIPSRYSQPSSSISFPSSSSSRHLQASSSTYHLPSSLTLSFPYNMLLLVYCLLSSP